MLWLALYFPNLPLEIFTRQHFNHAPKQQTQKPIVVLENNRICRLNEAAAQHGVILGSTLATAHSICPTLLHQQRSPARETHRLTELINSLYCFSSHICMQSPDCILLEIGGSLRLFGNHKALQQAALELCQTLGHSSVARVAQTPWAAIALARSQQTELARVPLANAGLEMAEVAHKVIERFDNMGIYTLGPLLELPPTQIGKRFGKKLLIYLEQLTGTRPDPRPAIHPAPDFDQQLHLLEPMIEKEGLCSGPMAQLTQELQHWLIAHQLGCTEIEWQFFSKQKETIALRFADARQNAADILAVSRLRLEQAELPAEVLGVGLFAKRTQAWQNQSESLFQLQAHSNHRTDHQEKSAATNNLVDEINARLGDSTCTSITCLEQHTPELAWRADAETTGIKHRKKGAVSASIPISTSMSSSSQTPSSSSQTPPSSKRPVWLFNPPRQVARQELALLQGPERIQSSWWVKTTSRDYYIAQHHTGAECWAFVDAENRWYLHGYFS